MGTARWFYNQTVEYLKQKGTVANRFSIQKGLLSTVPERGADVPFKVKQMAIEDACAAVRMAKKQYLQDHKFREVKFRKKRSLRDSIYIPSQAVRQDRIYPRKLGEIKFSEKLPESGGKAYDCRLIYDHDDFYLIFPFEKKVKKPETQRFSLVAIDPGIRTFVTFYSSEDAGKIGEHDFGEIARLCYYQDKLISRTKKRSKDKGKRQALFRNRKKIKNLVDEIHWKTISFLTDKYENILIPDMDVQRINRKLRSKTARSLLTWSHKTFLGRLRDKCVEKGCKLFLANESYTSKTCSACGFINEKLGSKEEWKCNSCGLTWDRDLNGARGIYLRALRDPSLGFLGITSVVSKF